MPFKECIRDIINTNNNNNSKTNNNLYCRSLDTYVIFPEAGHGKSELGTLLQHQRHVVTVCVASVTQTP